MIRLADYKRPVSLIISFLSGSCRLCVFLFACDFEGSDGVCGNFVHSERSKKERLRRLSVVGRTSTSYEDCEMGCDLSDKEDELRLQAPSMSTCSSKRFKIPKKFFDDCNGVDHASVPRKLRSAMKKRNCESISPESISPPLPDSKKLKDTISGVQASPIKNGAKKSKLNVKHGGSDWSPEQTLSGPITKDEEEVVETLYALAGMFPNNDANEKSKVESKSREQKPVPESRASPMPIQDSAVTKDNLSSMPLITAKVVDPSDRLPKETGKIVFLDEPSIQEQPDLPAGEKILMELDCSVHQLNLTSMPVLASSDNDSVKPLHNSELSLDTGVLNLPTQPETPLIERKPEMALGAATAVTTASELEQQNRTNEPKKNGSILWPGLSSVVSYGGGSHGPSLQYLRSSDARIPGWLDAAMIASRHRSSENGSSSGKVSKVTVEKNTWKRCAAHVHISHLIQISKMPESQERLLLQLNQLRPEEKSNLGFLMATNRFDGVRNSLNDVMSSAALCNSATERISNEAKTDILQPQRLHQDQPQAPASGVYTQQKQSFDFLSLSAGDGEIEAKNRANRAGNGLDPLSQLQVPYLHCPAQQQTLMPFTMPQTRYTSSAYPDQRSVAPAAAHQLQVAPYLGSPYRGPNPSPMAWTKQQQQQHQHLWAAQLAAHYRPGGTSTSMTQVSSWQQGRQDLPMLIPFAQTITPPSPSSLEVLGPKYTTVSQQQQHIMAIATSLPPARVKKQDHLISSVYEETGGGCHATGALPLQLLCNERR
ncbi:uncharacterized protein LOC121260790 isoform X4 [Juglans microcarpa x Juglans regia]|uniref:uncharacterized protein LOC121260790 isoform X4 n=1 Tax=Juglans microcarpa x Juglans regia TaxID=2249226 RepID=UPI001B7EB418|nr:uncharacterized protein LOC121260790 isoform X4 [Juglans microcarpa x Juglans regia]